VASALRLLSASRGQRDVLTRPDSPLMCPDAGPLFTLRRPFG